MFIDISQLREINSDEYNRITDRWRTQQGIRTQKTISDLINQGAGEDFLQREFQYGSLKGFLDDELDLQGINLHSLDVNCPQTDNFQGIDFSYGTIIKCEFKGCTFSSYFYFVQFKQCKFIDCKIFNSSKIDTPKNYPNGNWNKLKFDLCTLSDFYTEISLGYKETKSLEKSSDYRYLARKAYTRHNVKNKFQKWTRILINEFVIGYGEKPINVLRAAILLIFIFGILYQLSGLRLTDTSMIISYKISPSDLMNEFWNADSINQTIRDFFTSLYFSMQTFLIIGVDNIQTTNIIGTALVIIQSFLGITLIGAWTAVLLKKIMQ